MRAAPLGKLLVLDRDELPRGIATQTVPPAALMAEHLNIDAEVVERLDSLWSQQQRPVERVGHICGERRVLDDGDLVGNEEVAVNVHDLHPYPADEDLAAFARCLRRLSRGEI